MAGPSTEQRSDLVEAIKAVAYAIAAPLAPSEDASGGVVDSLTEAVMGITAAVVQVAESLDNVADAIRGHAAGRR